MSIFVNRMNRQDCSLVISKNVKSLFIFLFTVLIVFLILGQLLAAVISRDYKESMISHDNAVAGILKQENIDPVLIQKAFTSEKSSTDLAVGKELLESAGYNDELKENLFLNIMGLHQKYAFFQFILPLLAAAAVLLLILNYLLILNRKLIKASADIDAFLDGNTDIRLAQEEEGSLSGLFGSVNKLATSLNSHIIKERQNKEFLKDTISNISHQLKTPLAALRMYNEILQEEHTENTVISDFLSKTDRELNRMETLIRNLLKLARLDSGMVILNRNNKQLKGFLEELTEDFSKKAENEDKQLILTCDEQMTLYFDEEWLYEALSNIIKNAFDHTKAHDRIDIICQETPVLKKIIIMDNGSGIHPEDMPSVFKRFYRSRYSKDKQGIGIGLTLSKMIVELHDGSLSVESEPGKGAAFCLTFLKLTNM